MGAVPSRISQQVNIDELGMVRLRVAVDQDVLKDEVLVYMRLFPTEDVQLVLKIVFNHQLLPSLFVKVVDGGKDAAAVEGVGPVLVHHVNSE